MPKISVRVDNDLYTQIEDLDGSKSEIVRDALESYLYPDRPSRASLDDVETKQFDGRSSASADVADGDLDVHIRIGLPDGQGITTGDRADGEPPEQRRDSKQCENCGETVNDGQQYCPNCGEAQSQPKQCACGEAISVEWEFCPECGRRIAQF